MRVRFIRTKDALLAAAKGKVPTNSIGRTYTLVYLDRFSIHITFKSRSKNNPNLTNRLHRTPIAYLQHSSNESTLQYGILFLSHDTVDKNKQLQLNCQKVREYPAKKMPNSHANKTCQFFTYHLRDRGHFPSTDGRYSFKDFFRT